jgi:HlyD family secretion protein
MMKKKIWIGIGVLLALAVLAWAFMPQPLDVEIAGVSQGRFERAVQEDGKTRLRERYVVSTPLTGRITRLHLKQGDPVAANAAVATLWPVDPTLLDERARAEQTARIGAMEASAARARANMERALAALEQARIELKRSEALASQGFVSPNQNETGQLNVRLREKELESARQEEDAARHELDQSRIALKQYAGSEPARQQKPYEIKAPAAGKVLKLIQQSEGMVPAGTALLELGDPAQLEVVADILTEDAAQITPGTAVQLSNWGGAEMLEGRVRLIEPGAFTKVSALGVEEQRVKVVIDFTSPAERWQTLGDGFKVDVRVLVQVVDNAVKVPVSALFPVGARSGLFVLEQGRAHQRVIDVAARNGVEAWVRSGLTAGTQVIIYPDTQLRDGDRVRPRQTR